MAFRANPSTSLYFQWHNRNRLGLNQINFNDSEKTQRIGIRKLAQNYSANVSIELANTIDKLLLQRAKLIRYSISASFRPAPKQSFHLNINYSDHKDPTRISDRNLTIGVNVSSQIFKSTFVYLNFLTTNNLRYSSFIRDIFEAKLNREFSNKHKIEFALRYASTGYEVKSKLTAFTLEYSIPFGFSNDRKKHYGIVKGQFINVEKGKPVQNIIVRLNALSTVTDKNGEFVFPFVIPGRSYLIFEASNQDSKIVSVEKMTVELNVVAGQEKSVPIHITRAVSVVGQVNLYGYAKDQTNPSLNNRNFQESRGLFRLDEKEINQEGKQNSIADLVKKNGLQNLIVEVRKDNRVERRITDSLGRFAFENLSPGEWILSVGKEGLPDYHKFEKEKHVLNLKPGDSRKIEIKVIPQKRSIRMIHDGGILKGK